MSTNVTTKQSLVIEADEQTLKDVVGMLQVANVGAGEVSERISEFADSLLGFLDYDTTDFTYSKNEGGFVVEAQ